MAKMVPNVISPKIKSQAEKQVFNWFRDDDTTKNWIVLHSLGIENHQTLVFGEIDFLVLASDLGIFALEVKGGRIQREEGVWVYIDRYGNAHKKVRGPFEQALEGMYSVIEEVGKRVENKQLARVVHGYGVMFPDVEFDIADVETSQEIVFDKRDGKQVGKFIKRLSDYHVSKLTSKNVYYVSPNIDHIKDILFVLRKDFDKAVSIKTKVDYAEEQLFSLTQEQYRCIDGLSMNPRCLIHGPAGTGKTILALKHAKESVAQGKKVALFCYNLLLSSDLKYHFIDKPEVKPAYIGSFTEFMENLVKQNTTFDFNTITDFSRFYKEDLPIMVLDIIENKQIKFDELIIDEAQDLMHPYYIEIMDVLLIGGLKNGDWYFFGDYEYQTIYNRELSLKMLREKLEDQSNFSIFNLTVNCRNTQNIQSEMNHLIGKDIQVLNRDKYEPKVIYHKFDSLEHQIDLIGHALDELISSGIKPSQITLLSPFKYEKSVASKLTKYKIDLYHLDATTITYSTIQGFKGLENSVIFLLDIQTYNKPDLMYVGMSRARTLLYIFETEHAEQYRKNIK